MRQLAILSIVLITLVACSPKEDDGGAAASTAGMDNAGHSGDGDGDGDGDGGVSGTSGGESGTSGGSGGDSGSAGEGGAGEGGESGAGEGGSGGTDPIDVPLTELPGALAGAICEALHDCLGTAKLRQLAGLEDCEARLGAELSEGELAYIDMSIDAGRVLYDPAQLAGCLDGIREMGCAVATDTFPEPCVEVLAGNVPEGGECLISPECQGTAFCSGRLECPSTCQPLLDEDDECLTDDECGDDLLCIGGTCETLAADGDACAGDSGKLCQIGFSCVGSTPEMAGTCAANSVVQAGELEDECMPGGILCEEGLSCVYDGSAAFHCEAAVADGEACHAGLPGQCPIDQYCDTTDVLVASTCRDLPTEGDDCVVALNDICAPGYACVIEGMDHVCHEIADNGEPCTGDAACRSGNCVDAECAPPTVCL